MNNEIDNYFWPSYVDLFIGLFFVGLILFTIAYVQKTKSEALIKKANLTEENVLLLDSIIAEYERKLKELEEEKRFETLKKEGYERIRKIDKDIKQVMDNDLFIYKEEINGYQLNIPVKFKTGIDPCGDEGTRIPEQYKPKLKEAGIVLDSVLRGLHKRHPSVDFILVVAGRSSVTTRDQEILTSKDYLKIGQQRFCNYQLSYKRAYSLYQLWKRDVLIDFDGGRFEAFLDFHIAGNGYGGAGRYPRKDSKGNYDRISEGRNQGFVVEIMPKVADLILVN